MPHLLCLKGKKESYILRPGPAFNLLQYRRADPRIGGAASQD